MHRVLFAILLAGAAAMQASAWPTSPPKQTREAKAKVAEQDRAKATETKRTARQQSKAQAARPNPKPTAQAQKAPQTHPAVKPRVQNRPVSRPVTRAPSLEHRRPPVVSKTPRFGTQPPLRAELRPTPQPHWNTGWRSNHHYDWHDYRQHHRSVYHLHSYRDPFGWAYQVFAIGWRLWPNYYSSSYWINDPWMYRLPPAPPGTRWIRYYNDALLVDMWSGEVIDVIHNFFW